jgi:hypothetical protein
MKDTSLFLRNFEAKINNYVIMKWSILNQPLGSSCPAGSPTRKEWIWAIPAVISAATSIYGAAKSASANNEAEAKVQAEKAATEAERRRKKYESWTDTASGQNTMRMLRDMADREYKRSSGAAAVGGKTEASVAAEKELQNQKQAEVIANAVAAHEDKKDQVDASYRQQISGLNQQLIGIDQAKGQAVAQAASGIGNAMMQVAAGIAGGMTGNGSPAGGGVTPTSGSTPSQLSQMGKNYGVLNPFIYQALNGQGYL